jgi:hypothetical protein
MASNSSSRKKTNEKTNPLKPETKYSPKTPVAEDDYLDEKKRQAAQPLYLKRYE